MAGLGSGFPTYGPLRDALEAHAREVYGDEYILQDFVLLGFVVSMNPSDTDKFEYIMATSSDAPHITDGLLDQVSLFRENDDD